MENGHTLTHPNPSKNQLWEKGLVREIAQELINYGRLMRYIGREGKPQTSVRRIEAKEPNLAKSYFVLHAPPLKW